MKDKIIKLDKFKKSGMKNKNFEIKEYVRNMNVFDERIKFKIRTEMIDAKFNYKNDLIHRAKLWQCDSCQSSIETQDHILWCPA